MDTVAAGTRGPVTGNVISGEGTQFGAASSDLSAADAQITAITGTGGQDSSFSGGKLSVTGEYGKLSIDADGNYSYLANQGAPENSRDRFTYTLADKQGNSDSAALTIEIGKTPTVVQANAQQVVIGPDGVVVLPAGVQLSDIHVVGRNLVVNLPDGTQMVIIDGAVFVPQLVLGTVEVPATNLAALLIDSEPRPAAGTPPPSGGGNFALPPGPLDPGVPLGDLLPPTEMVYTPPDVREVNGILDREPEIFVQPDGQPASVAAVDSVEEAGLPTRNEGEPAGSGESADGNGADNDVTSEATGGLIVYDSPDGVDSITINGVVITGVGQVINGAFGTLVITSIADGQIGYNYTLLDNTSGNATHDDFSVVLTDDDGDTASATLTINIVDDVPTARNDTDASVGGIATGNVMTDAAPGDVGDSDTNAADTVGADNATLTAVSGAGGSDSTFSEGLLSVNGQFGVLTIDAQGNYTYTVNPNAGGGGVDVFNYTLTDGDGDTTTATLTITNPDLIPNLPDPAAVLLDDDALANGNPGGTGDDIDSSGTPGALLGTGGDGDLDYAFTGTNTLPAGFTVNAVDASTLQVLQGGTVVLTITLNTETGAYTVVQNNPIDHAAGLDENNISFGIGVQVVDVDGDVEPATITINVDDDTPTIGREDVSLPTLTVDETVFDTNATGDFSTVFDGQYGADGAGTTSYAVSVVNGTDSGLVDVATGQPILLYNIGGVVTGSTSATLAGVNAGNTDFTVSVNSATGVVTLDQVRALDHPVNPNPDDSVSPNPTSIQLTATITDGDGDPANLTVNIGGQLVFDDDGPSVNPALNANATVTLDESLPSTAATLDLGIYSAGDDPDLAGGLALGAANSGVAIVNANAAFGADGPAATGSLSYALSITNAASGVTLTDGSAINLVMQGGVIVGVVAGGAFDGDAAFAIAIDPATGVVTVEQYLSLDHPVNPNPNDPLGLGSGTVGVTVTATDGDGDPITSGAIDVSGNVTFLDDGPSVAPVVNAQATVTVDESLPSTAPAINTGAIVKGDDPDLAGGFALGQANSGVAIVTANAAFGADGPAVSGSLTYALALGVSDTPLTLTDGSTITLQNVGDVIVGVVDNGPFAGQAAFAIAIDPATGVVSVEQYLSLDHPVNPNPNDPLGLGANTVGVTVTATDGDGDPVTSGAVDISGQITLLDDGPSADPVLDREATVTVDESLPSTAPAIDTLAVVKGDDPDLADGFALGQANSGSAVVDVNAIFGADGPAAGGGISYALSVTNVSSGVTLTDGTAINLVLLANGVVVGVVAAGALAGQAAFAVSVDSATGVMSVEQYLSLDHPVNPNPNDPLGLGENTLGVTATVTDGDGDSITTGAVDVSDLITFLDDGPSLDPALNANATVTVDESLPSDTPGIATGAIVKGNDPDLAGGLALGQSNSGVAIVNANAVFGADGPAASASLTYALSVTNVSSGVTLTDGTAINLQNVGGVIVGVVQGAGAFAGQAAFAISINATTGVVTVEQYLSLDHPTNPNQNEALFLGAGSVGVTVTATDGDGDPVTSGAVDISGNISFLDDGPSAANDVDSVVGGFAPATGNVITGVDVVGGDANSTDGVADAPGADGGGITRIASNNNGNFDTVPTGGDFVVIGQYGTLTINQNGDYSYVRAPATPGGVNDVFTYTLTDGDGDPVTATLTIGIDDNFPLAGDVNVQLDDETLAGGIAGGTGDVNPDTANTGGFLPGSGGDGALTFDLLLTGAPLGFSYVDGPAGAVHVFQGAVHVVTIALTNTTTGAYTVTQIAPIDHADGLNENNVQFTVNYRVTDADGDFADGTIDVDVDDDTPTIDVTQANEGSVLLTTQDAETDGVPTPQDTAVSTANFSGVFGLTQAAGADGAPLATLSYALAVTNAVSGLASHGLAINLYFIGGKVVGSTSGTQVGVDAANTVFDIGVSGTGVVTLTQYSQVDHALEAAPNAAPFDDQLAVLANGLVTLTASSTITDSDNDIATNSEVVDLGGNIRFADDGPIAVNDTVGQVTENLPFSFGVFGNDQFGADGVDIDNAPTVNVTFTQPAAGSVSYSTVTGLFTFTPAAGQQGSTSFTYTIIDFDGDTSTATVTVNLQPDSTPVAADGVAAVDDDGLLAGNNNSSLGDLNANTGEAAVVNPSEAVWHGQLAATSGGDTIVNYTFASMHGTNGTVGTETVVYGWTNGTSTLTATTVGGTRPGTLLFDVVVNQATGSYNLTLRDNVLHADEVANQENDATTNLTFTVTDSDTDTDTGTIVVTFDDDMPVVNSFTSPLQVDNDATPTATGTFNFDIGADENADFDDILVSNFAVSVNGVALAPADFTLTPGSETATTANYTFSFDYETAPGETSTALGTLVFNKADGTYTVSLTNGPLEGFSILQTATGTLFQGYDLGASTLDGSQPAISVTQLQGTPGDPQPDDLFLQFTSVTEPSSGTGANNLRTISWDPDPDPANPAPGDGAFVNGELFNQAAGWVSTSGSANGVDGDTIQGGEVLDFNIVVGANPTGILAQPEDFGTATTMFLKFDGIGTGEDMIVILKLYDPILDIYTTRAVMIQNTDIQHGPGSGPGIFSGVTLDNNDGLVIIEANDYNVAGENWVIVGAQIAGSDEGVTGTAINLNGAIGVGGDSDVDNNGSLDTQSFATDVNDGPFKISSIGLVTEATTDQNATLNFDVTIEDADGDAVTQAITVNIGDVVAPLAAKSTAQVMREAANDDSFSSLSSTDTQKYAGPANNNTGIVAGIVAASGLMAMPLAAADIDGQQFDLMSTSIEQGFSQQMAARVSIDDLGGNGLDLGNAVSQVAPAANDLGAASRGYDDFSRADLGLTDLSAGGDVQDVGTALAMDQGPSFNFAATAAFAPAIGMPAAAQLVAAGLTGNGQQGGSVEQVLADALGAGAAPTVDALLQALPGQEFGGNAGFDSLASPIGDYVPAWDMGSLASSGSIADMMFRMDVAMLHHDAVQPVVNG